MLNYIFKFQSEKYINNASDNMIPELGDMLTKLQ